MEILRFESVNDWSAAVAAWLEAQLESCGEAQPLVVVPGGRTPWPILERVAASGISARVRWTLTDERCLALADPGRNESQLLKVLPGAVLLPLLDVAGRVVQQTLPVPDVSLIGMGEDGHVASLFPGSSALEAGLSASAGELIEVADAPDGRHRVSRSLQGLAGRAGTAIVIRGQEKLSLIQSEAALGLPVGKLLGWVERVFWCP